MTMVKPEASTATPDEDQRPHSATPQPITRVVVDERTLAPGADILHEQDGDTVRIVFDPEQTTRAVVRALASVIYGRSILAFFESAPAVRVRSLRLDGDTPAALRDTATVLDLAIDFSHSPEEITEALRALFQEAIETRRWTRRQPPASSENGEAATAMHTPVPADATPEQAASMAEIDRIINESGDPAAAARQFLDLIEQEKAETAAYVPPTDCADAEAITCADERGAIIKAYLHTPMWGGAPEGPTRLSVYTEPYSEGELDAAGATNLIVDLEEFLPRLRAMRDVLAAQDGQ
ncbi:hypothetical protein V2S66_32895 [Streptomyces sp. V4-01]|uniref:Uncharacterized protein n=1 Tax=Actinacidiphila polyblastidii TaxID=3110430 RepID=A0ABU7PLQ4_9ACTN|nr:hypothetical protein [Streptomyces sp. V4-01]